MGKVIIGLVCALAAWSSSQEQRLTEAAAEVAPQLLQSQPHFEYPFGGRLRGYLEKRGLSSAPIFSYGSLMNAESAARTLSGITVESRQPALALGIQRVYNYVPSSSTQYDLSDPQSIGMLNVVETGNMRDVVNGVVLWIPLGDVRDLCERETGYDLIPVVVTLWGEEDFFVAYTFSAPDEPRLGVVRTSSTVEPLWDYHMKVKQGAASYGPDFHDLYLDKTYLSDRKTLLRQWERQRSS